MIVNSGGCVDDSVGQDVKMIVAVVCLIVEVVEMILKIAKMIVEVVERIEMVA